MLTDTKRLESLISLEDEASINVHPLDLDIGMEHLKAQQGLQKYLLDGKVRSTKTYFIKSDESSKKDEAFRRVIFHNYLNKNQLPRKLLITNQLKERKLLQDALNSTFNLEVRILTKAPKGKDLWI